jgi:CheY-like chemotaxis protein
VNGISVLVVEDDETMRRAVSCVLERAGYVVTDCRDYVDALAVLESTAAVDVMLTDIDMPGAVNGFALARMARLRRSSLRVVYMTGLGDLPEKEVKAALGIIIRKPFTGDELLAGMADALDKRTGS